MSENNFIAAIELGSSKVIGLVGRKQPDGAINVLAYAQEPSVAFIRKGRIFNVDKMQQCISNMKEKLEKKLQSSISQVYVGIGGMGMHSVGNNVVRHFSEKTVITQEIIDNILDTNRATSSTNREILDVQPLEYKFGTQLQLEALGVVAESIEGRFLNIVASSSLCEQVENCFRASGVAIAEKPISVKLLADAVLTEAEKRSGCVLVDMGAETTSVAVYKGNLLRHFAVLPLGGSNITRDIMSLNIDEEEAEQLKLTYGSAITEAGDKECAPITLRDGRTIPMEEFADLVEARMEEIILNIDNQIKLSKYEAGQLIGGLIITGGASKMKNIEKAFTKHTNFDKQRFVKTLHISVRTNASDFNKDGSFNTALAILETGTINCCGGKLGETPTGGLFPTPEEIAEQQRKEAEAAEAKRIAEEAAAAAEAQRLAEEEAEREGQRAEKSTLKNWWKKLGEWMSEEDENQKS